MDIAVFFSLYISSIVIFFVVDMAWLGWVARNFYQAQIGYILGPVKWSAAIIFYFVYLLGLVYFAAYPGYQSVAFTQAFMLGGLFGFFTYATYDMTNLATVRDWPLRVTIVDIVWGTILGAVVSGGAVVIVTALLGG